MSLPRVLFVDDEPEVPVGVTRALRGRYEPLTAHGGEEALRQLALRPVEVVVSDLRLPVMDGASPLARVRAEAPGTVCMVKSGHGDQGAVARSEVFRFLEKPVKRELIAEAAVAEGRRRAAARGDA